MHHSHILFACTWNPSLEDNVSTKRKPFWENLALCAVKSFNINVIFNSFCSLNLYGWIDEWFHLSQDSYYLELSSFSTCFKFFKAFIHWFLSYLKYFPSKVAHLRFAIAIDEFESGTFSLFKWWWWFEYPKFCLLYKYFCIYPCLP